MKSIVERLESCRELSAGIFSISGVIEAQFRLAGNFPNPVATEFDPFVDSVQRIRRSLTKFSDLARRWRTVCDSEVVKLLEIAMEEPFLFEGLDRDSISIDLVVSASRAVGQPIVSRLDLEGNWADMIDEVRFDDLFQFVEFGENWADNYIDIADEMANHLSVVTGEAMNRVRREHTAAIRLARKSADSADPNGSSKPRRSKTPTTNDLMKAELASNLSEVQGLKAHEWAELIGRSKTSVIDSPTWKELQATRQQLKIDHSTTKRQGRKGKSVGQSKKADR